MPNKYVFRDSKICDNVARSLLFVAKFSRDQAIVKFSDSSVSIIWGGSPKTYYIHTEVTDLQMFKKNHQQVIHNGVDHFTIIQVNPSTLGRTLKVGHQDRSVTLTVHGSRNKVQVTVVQDDNKRTMVHTLPCETKTLDDYNNMLIEEIEKNICRYDTKSYVENIHRFRHIVDCFVKLNTPRIYIWSQQSKQGNDLIIETKTQGSTVCVSLSDLEDGFANMDDEDCLAQRRSDAGVNIDTKKLAAFLSGLSAQKRSKMCFEIEHNKCLKVALDQEVTQGEKSYQSLLLIHSLNN